MEGEGNQRHAGTYSDSPLTMQTLDKIHQKSRRGPRQQLGCLCTFHDNSSPAYNWLLPGWLAEERLMPSGRLYKYYYDPSGHSYRTQNEVLLAWEQSGMILLEK